jgi:predicted cobalt transporter CbtA
MSHDTLKILQTVTHYSLHLLAPGLIAFIFFRSRWKQAWLIMLATMLVDADHLLATPVFDPSRCSIGYHPLHSYYAIAVYFILLRFPKTRVIAVGLLFHMLTDWQDCQWTMFLIA